MSKRRTINGPGQGSDLVLLAGLPLDTLKTVQNRLASDRNRRPAKYDGAPSPKNDWNGLYSDGIATAIQRQMGAFMERGETHVKLENIRKSKEPIPTPRRI